LTPGQVLRIGRAEENDARPDCHGLSRRHSEVDYRDGGWIVRDLGSTNGTWLNDHRVAPNGEEPLADGDRVRAGEAVFVFQLVQARFRLCPVCGDGQVYPESALLANGLARPGILVCGRCGTVIREADGQFGIVFVPWAYALQRRRLGVGLFTAQELGMFGEAALDELEVTNGDGNGGHVQGATARAEAAPRPAATESAGTNGGAKPAARVPAAVAPGAAAHKPAPEPPRAAPEPKPEPRSEPEPVREAEIDTEPDPQPEDLGPSAVEMALASLERAFAAEARGGRGR